MNGTTDDPNQSGNAAPGGPRATPIAAIAGAVVLAGLVGFALYRRAGAPAEPAGATPPAAGEASGAADSTGATEAAPADDPDAPRGAPPHRTAATPAAPPTGTPIVAQAPLRLSPEANILAERYRCVCGCNDPLSVCTCRLTRGSEEMKAALKDMADGHLLPEEVDRAMTLKFGAAALLTNPAPPQTQPSHAAGALKKP